MDLAEKLEILADSAKYDVACTSSGVNRPGRHGALGSSAAAGICHAFTADGRCVSLLKVLYSNVCSYDCSYCVNRRSNDRPRATFTPRELAFTAAIILKGCFCPALCWARRTARWS